MAKSNKTELILSFLSRLTVWGGLFGVVFLLRSFFLLMFLTFIFAYIQSHAVDRLKPWISNRTLRATIVGIIFLSFLVMVGALFFPNVKEQAIGFVSNFSKYAKTLDTELVRIKDTYPIVAELLPEIQQRDTEQQDWDFKHSTLASFLQPLIGMGGNNQGESLKTSLDAVKNIGSVLLAISSSFLLSLLFSFLIVLDLPRLTQGTRSLRQTKLRFVYEEVSNSIYSFGKTLGKAFQAQFFIAILNTILTAIGIWIIGIRGEIAFISLIVFFCSFIPIAGVFLSSVPICLLALESGGFPTMLLSIALIWIIHLLEAYVINPRIFGHHLRLNTIVVLILLTVSGKLFGIWGLVLCLPVATYIFKDAIQIKKDVKFDLHEDLTEK